MYKGKIIMLPQKEEIATACNVAGKSQIYSALIKFQSKINNPDKNRKVSVNARNGKDFTYSYTDLANILEHIKELMGENNLAILQTMTSVEGKLFIETRLIHSSGEDIRDLTPIMPDNGNNKMQSLGAAMTYARRYAIQNVLGLAGEEDSDGVLVKENDDTSREYSYKKPVKKNVDNDYVKIFKEKYMIKAFDEDEKEKALKLKYLKEKIKVDSKNTDQNYWQDLCNEIDKLTNEDYILWKTS